MKYTVSCENSTIVENVSEESNRPFTWINTVHISNDGETSQEGHPKPNKKGYFAGDKLYNSYDALFNSPEFKEALDYAKEDCEATGYTPVSEREARQYAVNKRCAYRVVQGIPVLYKRTDADTGTMVATTLLIGVPISGNKQTDIVTAFIIARNPKGKEKKVMIAKKIEVKKSKTLDVTHHNAAAKPKRK